MRETIQELAAELATVIVGISPDASRERGPDESVFDVGARRAALDRRLKIEGLLVKFGNTVAKGGT